jgi:plastocyanin
MALPFSAESSHLPRAVTDSSPNGDSGSRSRRARLTDIVGASAATLVAVVALLTLFNTLGWLPTKTVRPPEPQITLSKTSGDAGTRLQVTGSGFLDEEGINAFVNWFQVGTAQTDDEGNFTLRIRIPEAVTQVPLPQLYVSAVGAASGRVAQAALNLGTSNGPPPPTTTDGPTTTTPSVPTDEVDTGITLTADPSGALTFDQIELTAAAGQVTVELVNDSGVPHNVEVEGNGVEEVSDTISEGSTELTLALVPGEYEFYCAVPGHREGGMEGTLTVE